MENARQAKSAPSATNGDSEQSDDFPRVQKNSSTCKGK